MAADGHAGTSHKRVRAELRERLRGQGATGREIAEAMMATFKVSPLLAYRWAHDLSQQQACDRYNDRDPGGRCGLDSSRLSQWENWPHSDRRPPAHALRRFAEIYRTSSNLLVPVEADYTHLDVPAISTEMVEASHIILHAQESPLGYAHVEAPPPPDPLDAWDEAARADGWPWFGEGRPDVKRQQFLDWTKWAALGAVLESLSLTRDAEGPGGGPATHQQLDLALRHFGEVYERTPRNVMFAVVRKCRTTVAELRGYPQGQGSSRHLLLVSGWLSALLGYLEFDRGDYFAARSHHLAAWQVGQHLGDADLTAWVSANQSMTELYAGDFVAALNFASFGLRIAPSANYPGPPLGRGSGTGARAAEPARRSPPGLGHWGQGYR